MKRPLRIEGFLPKYVTTHVPMFRMLGHTALVVALAVGVFALGMAADRFVFRPDGEAARAGELATTKAAFKSCNALLDDWVRDQQAKKWRTTMQARDKAFHNPAVRD